MILTKFCVKKPVTTLMFCLGILLLGFISWSFLPQELLPPLTYPQITVLTTYEGASPQEIESLITRPIEEAVGTVNKVKKISSVSKEETSIVMVEFDWNANIDFSSLEVREKIDLIKDKLPREAKEPIVMKFNPFDTPVIQLNLVGDISPLKLRKIAKKDIKEELEKLEGVGSVEITGGLEREILVEVEEPRLRAASLSILDITEALKRANLNYPAGSIKEPFFEFLIRTLGEFQNLEEIEDLPVKVERPLSERGKLMLEQSSEEEKTEQDKLGYPEHERLIFIKNIAEVKDTTKERKSLSRYKGKESVTLSIRRQSQANVVNLAKTIKKEIQSIEKKLPAGLELKLIYDQSLFIKQSLTSVRDSAVIGGILAFIVLFLFLRNLWFSIIIIISVPVCVLTVIILMFVSKISLNIVSLGGLALGIGMLVDNAIVVLESIFLNSSKDLKDKVILGTAEVSGAITGSTLTTICVFLPMIFVVGIAGQLFKQLAFTIVFSLLASIVTALTIIPVMVYIRGVLPSSGKEVTIDRWGNIFSFFFRHRKTTLIAVFSVFIGSLMVFAHFNRELLPRADYHEFSLNMDCEPGTSLEQTDRISREIEQTLSSLPQVEEFSLNIGSSSDKPEEKALQSREVYQAQFFIKVKKTIPTIEVIDILKEKLQYLKRNNVSLNFLAQESFLKNAFAQQAPLVLEIKGSNLDKLKEIGKELKAKIEPFPFLYNTKLDFSPPRPEIKAEIKKDKAFLFNLNTQLIAETLNTSIKGKVPTKYKEKGEEYDIRVKLREKDRDDVSKLNRLLVHGFFRDNRVDVPLMEIAAISEGLGPTEIKRIASERTILLTSSIYKAPLSKVIAEVEKEVDSLNLPLGYKIDIGGEGKSMSESFQSLKFALILAIILVFMVMASEFESLWQPFIILITLPLSLIGVTAILYLTGIPLNIISFLGLILLGGVVVNNGIVLIEYINLLFKNKDLSLEESLRLASIRRIRPILMTSLTTILGLIPLSSGIGGTQLMQSLGLVNIGGLASAAFLTPMILPLIFYYFVKTSSFFTSKTQKLSAFLAKLKPVKKQLFPGSMKLKQPLEKEEEEEGIDSEQMFLEEEEEEEEESQPETIGPEPASSPAEDETSSPEKEQTTPEPAGEKAIEKEQIKPPEPEGKPGKQKGRKITLNKRQEALVDYLKKHGQITRVEFARTFNISIPTASRDLKLLSDLGIIVGKGPLGPGRYYVLTNKK